MDWKRFAQMATSTEQRAVLETLDRKGLGVGDCEGNDAFVALGVVLRESLLAMQEAPGSKRRECADDVVAVLAAFIPTVLDAGRLEDENDDKDELDDDPIENEDELDDDDDEESKA